MNKSPITKVFNLFTHKRGRNKTNIFQQQIQNEERKNTKIRVVL